MPTTVFSDDSLTFLPQQRTVQPQNQTGAFINGVTEGNTSSSSAGSSNGSEYSVPGASQECSKSPLRSPDTTNAEVEGMPFLQFVEPPIEKCRFRYPTEMKGTHAATIMGRSTQKKEKGRNKGLYPSVKLCNYRPSAPNEQLIIRCYLYTADKDESKRIPHIHELKVPVKSANAKDIDDPIDIPICAPQYQAVFEQMKILYTKKEDQIKVLKEKKLRYKETLLTNSMHIRAVVVHQDQMLKEVQVESRSFDNNHSRLNTCCLRFEALRNDDEKGIYVSICAPLYSDPIQNSRSSKFNDLRICRVDKVVGTCLGGDEVFIFVEKVDKKDIKIRFFEIDSTGRTSWYAYAEFGESDVHYQHGIAFKTPRYKDTRITESASVYFELVRPSNNSRSEYRVFEYIPDKTQIRDMVRKRPRLNDSTIPTPVQDFSRSWAPNTSQLPWTSALTSSFSEHAMPTNSTTFSFVDEELKKILEEFSTQGESDWPIAEPVGMETDDISSSTPSNASLKALMSDLPSADSDNLSQMLGNIDALSRWARCNNVPDSTLQQCFSEATYLDDLVADGGSEGKSSRTEQPISGRCYNQMRNKLTPDNIVRFVKKVLSSLNRFKQAGRLTESYFQKELLDLFSVCVGEDEDNILHVLASSEELEEELPIFLNILTKCCLNKTIVKFKNNKGKTALHVAAEKGHVKTIELLLDNGADVNAKDHSHNTPVHLLAKRGKDAAEAFDLIQQQNPDLSICNEDGFGVLHLAVMNRMTNLVNAILVKSENEEFDSIGNSVNVNLQDRKQGNTALHIAVQKYYTEIVSSLLNLGNRIEVNIKNFDGETPLAYVMNSSVPKKRKIEDLLMMNDADPQLVTIRRKEKKDKLDNDEVDNDDTIEEVEDVDDTLPAHAHEWKSEAELKLLDANTVCKICLTLDEDDNWLKFANQLNFSNDFKDNVAKNNWSPTLFILKEIAATMPNIRKENVRELLLPLNSECRKAAQFIDDIILREMGVLE